MTIKFLKMITIASVNTYIDQKLSVLNQRNISGPNRPNISTKIVKLCQISDFCPFLENQLSMAPCD